MVGVREVFRVVVRREEGLEDWGRGWRDELGGGDGVGVRRGSLGALKPKVVACNMMVGRFAIITLAVVPTKNVHVTFSLDTNEQSIRTYTPRHSYGLSLETKNT